MQLHQEFTIPVELERAWQVLLDVEQVAPCFPGATLKSVDGDDVKGAVKVKLGPISLTYQGVLQFVERDEIEHRVVMNARGTDTKGNGSATAQVTAQLTAATATTTTCALVTDLNITGRPAQFGRGMMLEIGNKILGQFSDNLSESLTNPAAAPLEPSSGDAPADADARSTRAETIRAVPGARARPDAELDLLGAARSAALKRLAPMAAAAAVAIVAAVWWANR